MIIRNIDTNDGLVNGASGILREIDYTSEKGVENPTCVWIEFPEEKIGQKARSQVKCKEFKGKKLTPIHRELLAFTKKVSMKKGSKKIQVSRQQFPIVPAEAIIKAKAVHIH